MSNFKKVLNVIFVSLAATLLVAGAVTAVTTIGTSIATSGDITISTNKFVVTGTSGNLNIGPDLFTVAGATGNTVVAGALSTNTNSTTALLVEQDGVKNNVLIVDTTNGRVGVGSAPSYKSHIVGDTTVAVLGNELLTNADDRTFDSDTTNWSGTGWTIGSSVATHVAGANDFTHNVVLEGNTYYQVKATIVTTTIGTVRLTIGSTNVSTVGTEVGTLTQHTWVIITSTTPGSLNVNPSATWAGTIDNVTVMKITPNDVVARFDRSDKANLSGTELRVAGLINDHIGLESGACLISGNSNTAYGTYALRENLTGSNNIAFGASALRHNTTGSRNIAIGINAAIFNTTGTDNTGIGHYALNVNSIGTYNIAIGSYALATTKGSYNTAIGSYAGYTLTNTSSNIFIGYKAGYRQTTNSNLLIIDNQQRASVGEEATNVILYGVMAATPGSQTLAINAATTIFPNSAAIIPLVLKGNASQSANLQEWQNSSGTPLAYINASGNMVTTGSFTVGSGTAITKHLSATASLDFAAWSGNDCQDLTITVTGAVDGNTVYLGIPTALSSTAGVSFSGFVSVADTVTVRGCKVTAGASADPAAATVRADVWQH